MNRLSYRITSLMLALFMCAAICPLFTTGSAYADSAATASDITRRCIFEVSEGTKSFLTDGEVRRAWEYEGDSAQIEITLPSDIRAGYIFIYWLFDDESYDISELTSDGRLLRTRNQDATFKSIANCLPLLPETKRIKLEPNVAGQEICEIRIYTEGTLPANVMVWEQPLEKCDLMVVSAHQDDELIFFGGAIPYYAIAKDHPTQVVYMANCTRLRRQEALHGLWVMGMRNYPEFINLRDHNSDSMEEALQLWNGRETAIEVLVERIRRFKPEVILTHDLNGEYGHFQHQITARVMKDAIEAAADPDQYPASAAMYGAWQVKKLYLHLYDENVIEHDWNTPLEELGGKSPLEVARLGYAQHESQQEFYQVNDGGKYDNSKFGLYYTTVGLDTGKNDFFENIDEASLALSRVTAQPAFVPAGVDETPIATDIPPETEAPTEPVIVDTATGEPIGEPLVVTESTPIPTIQIANAVQTPSTGNHMVRNIIIGFLCVAGLAGAALAVNNFVIKRNSDAGQPDVYEEAYEDTYNRPTYSTRSTSGSRAQTTSTTAHRQNTYTPGPNVSESMQSTGNIRPNQTATRRNPVDVDTVATPARYSSNAQRTVTPARHTAAADAQTPVRRTTSVPRADSPANDDGYIPRSRGRHSADN